MDVVVRHLAGDRFAVAVRGHTFTVDQPVDAGGTDSAPAPTEYFAGAVAACVAFYARRYLARHDLPTEGLAVTASYAMADRPARIREITLSLVVPEGVPEERVEALLAVARHCTLHNTLRQPPGVSVTVAARAGT